MAGCPVRIEDCLGTDQVNLQSNEVVVVWLTPANIDRQSEIIEVHLMTP
jgi:hypothetical protein